MLFLTFLYLLVKNTALLLYSCVRGGADSWVYTIIQQGTSRVSTCPPDNTGTLMIVMKASITIPIRPMQESKDSNTAVGVSKGEIGTLISNRGHHGQCLV